MLRIYYGDVRELPLEAEEYPLSDYRLKKLKSMRLPLAIQQGIAAELLLIQAIREAEPEIELPLQLFCSTEGKPRLADSKLCFSLSHSGSIAACAIADFEIGLDVQMLHPVNMALARRFFTPQEQEFLSHSEDADEDFTMLWALKESWLKAIGTGFRTPLNTFSMEIGDPVRANGVNAAFWHEKIGGAHFALGAPGLESVFPDIIIEKKLP